MTSRSMSQAEADALPRCDRCGNRIVRPASRVVPDYMQVHWTCLTSEERADVRALEAESREFEADAEGSDYYAWSDADMAWDEAECSEWMRTDEGGHYCPDCTTWDDEQDKAVPLPALEVAP